MANLTVPIEIRPELRLCKVNGELGYFHCWEHYSKPVTTSTDSSIVSHVFGIVEFKDRTCRIDPWEIQFVDETNQMLKMMEENKMQPFDEQSYETIQEYLVKEQDKYLKPLLEFIYQTFEENTVEDALCDGHFDSAEFEDQIIKLADLYKAYREAKALYPMEEKKK